MKRISRRSFLGRSLAAGAAALCAPAGAAQVRPGGAKPGAGERVRIAVVGVRWTQFVSDHRGRGSEHVAGFVEMKDVEIAALCDVDERVIGESMNLVEAKTGKRPRYYKDFRKLLDDQSIDAPPGARPGSTTTRAAIQATPRRISTKTRTSAGRTPEQPADLKRDGGCPSGDPWGGGVSRDLWIRHAS